MIIIIIISTISVEPVVMPEFDYSRMETLVKEQCDKVISDVSQRYSKVLVEITEVKAMQSQLVDILAKVGFQNGYIFLSYDM